MKISCGCLLFSFNPSGKIGIILGSEIYGDELLPFKGCKEQDESNEETAIREVYEETCKLVKLENVNLEHSFSTKHKRYFIGLNEVPYNIMDKFEEARRDENRTQYKEKQKLVFITLEDVLTDDRIHNVAKASIRFYWDKLLAAAANKNIDDTLVRNHGISEKQAKHIKSEATKKSSTIDTEAPERHKRSKFGFNRNEGINSDSADNWRRSNEDAGTRV